MKSNSNNVRSLIRDYILECVDLSEYNLINGHRPTVLDVFKSEFEHAFNLKQYPNRQERFIEWALGLPTCLGMTTDYEEVRDILINRFKTNTTAKRDDTKSLRYFYALIYTELVRMDQEPSKESERMLNKIAKTFK